MMVHLFNKLTKALVAILLLSCSEQRSSFSAKQATAKKVEQSVPTLLTTGVQVVQKKYSASQLKVFDLVAAKSVEKDSQSFIVSFDVAGMTEYVDWTICPMEDTGQTCTDEAVKSGKCIPGRGECSSNVSNENKILVPNLFAGKILITAKACISQENAKVSGETCGEPKEIYFDSQVSNIKARTLLSQRSWLYDSLTKLEIQKFESYRTYQHDLEECIKFNAQAEEMIRSRIRVLDQYLRAPLQWLSQADDFTYGAGSTVLTGAKTVASTIVKPLQDMCGKTDKSVDSACVEELNRNEFKGTDEEKNEYCTKETQSGLAETCHIVSEGLMGFVTGMNPMTSFQTLSGAIHDLTDPEHSVAKNCTAEQKLKAVQDPIQKEIQSKRKQVDDLNKTLKGMGFL
ncbi:MAG: hypothetical protein KA436_02120 [Oligoflexales bacterium]|nr:hypothetical protein [Oligoflexales bacterium]